MDGAFHLSIVFCSKNPSESELKPLSPKVEGYGGGGHNGLTSIIEKVGCKDFVRVRIGIGKTGFWPWFNGTTKRPAGGGALERYVLGNFTKKELDVIDKTSVQILEVVATIVSKGHVAAMNLYN